MKCIKVLFLIFISLFLHNHLFCMKRKLEVTTSTEQGLQKKKRKIEQLFESDTKDKLDVVLSETEDYQTPLLFLQGVKVKVNKRKVFLGKKSDRFGFLYDCVIQKKAEKEKECFILDVHDKENNVHKLFQYVKDNNGHVVVGMSVSPGLNYALMKFKNKEGIHILDIKGKNLNQVNPKPLFDYNKVGRFIIKETISKDEKFIALLLENGWMQLYTLEYASPRLLHSENVGLNSLSQNQFKCFYFSKVCDQFALVLKNEYKVFEMKDNKATLKFAKSFGSNIIKSVVLSSFFNYFFVVFELGQSCIINNGLNKAIEIKDFVLDGKFVFSSNEKLLALEDKEDLVIYDLTGGGKSQIPKNKFIDMGDDMNSENPVKLLKCSADGRYVVFVNSLGNLVVLDVLMKKTYSSLVTDQSDVLPFTQGFKGGVFLQLENLKIYDFEFCLGNSCLLILYEASRKFKILAYTLSNIKSKSIDKVIDKPLGVVEKFFGSSRVSFGKVQKSGKSIEIRFYDDKNNITMVHQWKLVKGKKEDDLFFPLDEMSLKEKSTKKSNGYIIGDYELHFGSIV